MGTSASVVAAAQGAKDPVGISWALVCTRWTSSIGTGRDRSWEGFFSVAARRLPSSGSTRQRCTRRSLSCGSA